MKCCLGIKEAGITPDFVGIRLGSFTDSMLNFGLM